MFQLADYIFIVILVTVALTRLWLFVRPTSSPRLQGFKLHHYMYGLVIGIIGYIFSVAALLGIGLGLIIDELPLFIRYKNNDFHWKEYNSLYSRIGVVICLLLLFIIRRYVW